MIRTLLVGVIGLSLSGGCTRVEVIKNPSPQDDGFRYYRPKPYLFILPGEVTTDGKSKRRLAGGERSESGSRRLVPPADPTDSAHAPVPQTRIVQPVAWQDDPFLEFDPPTKKITLGIRYLPDFSEEYAVQLRPGLGRGEVKLTLEDGWNLTGVSVQTDQQTDEILASVADVATAVGGMVADAKRRGAEFRAAEYVPLGLYEAVVGRDPAGQKQFYGWRYVGFLPFSPCPVQAAGGETACCLDPGSPNELYALVWERWGGEDCLVFRRLHDIRQSEWERLP